jgi:hypothetical protein
VTTDELENDLRGLFARASAGIVMPEQARQRLLQHDYHPRRTNRPLAAGLAAIAVATAATAVPLAIGAGSQPAGSGAVIRLASHAFQLPAGYRHAATTSAPCHAFVIISMPAFLNPKAIRNPRNEPGMKAAASASGGCIVAVLTPPYTPTAARPDPLAPAAHAHPVRIGNYHGVLAHSSFLVTSASRTAIAHGITPGRHQLTELFVRLPAGNGRVRDLVLGASRLSGSEMIRIAASGLPA